MSRTGPDNGLYANLVEGAASGFCPCVAVLASFSGGVAPVTPLAPGALDAIGVRLPRVCRWPIGSSQRVFALSATRIEMPGYPRAMYRLQGILVVRPCLMSFTKPADVREIRSRLLIAEQRARLVLAPTAQRLLRG